MIGVEKNISWLDIAMEQIVLERHVERAGDFDADIQHVQLRKALLPFDSRIKAPPIGQFHDQVTLAIEFVESVDVNNISVIERGARASLAIKALEGYRI